MPREQIRDTKCGSGFIFTAHKTTSAPPRFVTATVSAEASTLSARSYTHQDTTLDTGRMASSACAAACAAARYVPTAGSAKSSRFAGNKAPFTARASPRIASRRAAMGAQAVVSPPQTHDNARPDTTLRPVSAAAVDSNKALEQFRSMGGASRKFFHAHISPHFLPLPYLFFFFFFPFFFPPNITRNRV